MLNFYVISTGHDMIALEQIQGSTNKNKIRKCEVPSENMGCTE